MVAEAAGAWQAWPLTAETTTNGVCCMDKTKTTLKPEPILMTMPAGHGGQRDAGACGGAAR
jgi:hypothetical protein